MSATERLHDSASPDSRAFITPVLGAPRQTTDLELTNIRLPSIKVTSPINFKSISYNHVGPYDPGKYSPLEAEKPDGMSTDSISILFRLAQEIISNAVAW